MPPHHHLWIPKAPTELTKHLTRAIRHTEALSLYREILRTAKAFHWVDEGTGEPWNSKLKREARKEFEASREETDPLIIARMMVTGRDCVHQIQIKFNDADKAAWERIRRDGRK